MQTKMSLQLYQVDSRTYLLDFRSIDGKFYLHSYVSIAYYCYYILCCHQTDLIPLHRFLLYKSWIQLPVSRLCLLGFCPVAHCVNADLINDWLRAQGSAFAHSV